MYFVTCFRLIVIAPSGAGIKPGIGGAGGPNCLLFIGGGGMGIGGGGGIGSGTGSGALTSG